MPRSFRRTVSLVTAWQVAASVCYYTVFAATPFFRDAFGLSRFEVGIVVTVLSLGYAAFQLPLGSATDRYGEALTLPLGLLALSAGVLLVAGAPTYAALLAAVFFLGSAYGVAAPGTNRVIVEMIAVERRNVAMGIKQVGVTAGSGLSALLVTGLAGFFVWQTGFLVASGLGILVAAAFALSYSSDGSRDGDRPEFRTLLGEPPFRRLLLAGVLLGAALFTTTGYTVLYVEETAGTAVVVAGAVLALVQLFGSVGRIVGGWLGDVLPGSELRRVGGILTVQAVAAAAVFLAVPELSSTLGAVVVFSVLGFFALGNTGIYFSCVATLVRSEEIGAASAGGQLALTAGALVGPPVFGYLADTVGYRAGWSALAGASLLAAALSLSIVRSEAPAAA